MDLATIFIALGALFSVGLIADQIGQRTRLPRVTLLLGCGLIAGDSGLSLIPTDLSAWYEMLSISALTLVAFLLGSSLTKRNLAEHGKQILFISISIVLFTIAFVAMGLWLMGLDLGVALILGAVATATAPAATQDVIRQSGVDNTFTRTLKGVVAIDDAWGLIAFGFIIVFVESLGGQSDTNALFGVLYELGGSIALGLVIGMPAAFLTGRLSKGQPLQIEALALVFLTAGLSLQFQLSYLISGMTAGMVIVNTARHHTKAFHEIEHIQWPFMILFFLLAGASLDLGDLKTVGIVGGAYLTLRSVARVFGGWVGARLGNAPVAQRPWFGIALMPQAGVAIGMALVASKHFPQWSESIMALTVSTTIAFELIGPFATLYAIKRVNALEAKQDV
ncbi:cation:proton antiporter [uncultured Shimia sp.]|uniref:cation:proton antiporter n=1 Tax=uncultured Shimia sp. TaxID=573152 RepID=UPI00260D2752|nr:cation:proton antiporter [uncultured Shimia sp.]